MPEPTILRLGDLCVTLAVSDVMLAKAYLKMLEEEAIDTVFFQGRPTLQDFLAEYLTQGRRVTLGCFREIPGKEIEFCGLGWVYGSVTMGKHKRAETGMWFSRRQTRKTDNLKFGQMCFSIFFDNYDIDALFGTTPEQNKLSIRYAQRLGMSLIGPIPDYCTWRGELTAGWISHISKAQWIERHR
jgi:RimJ/RimL family protein N-acetyltransferase